MHKKIITALLLLFACSHPKASTPSSEAPKKAETQTTSKPTLASMPSAPTTLETKPVIVVAPLAPTSLVAVAPEAIPAGELRGRTQSSRSTCGGMRPSEEMMKELRTPKPEAGLTLLFRKGERNNTKAKIVAEVAADSEGRFVVTGLAKGTYCIVEGAKKKSGPLPTWNNLVADKKCYSAWVAECDAVVTLGASHGEETEIIHYRGCGDPVCVPIPPRP